MDNTNHKDFQSMMTDLLKNAQKIQENLRQAYQQMTDDAAREVVGRAGGDLVIAHVNLKMQITRLELKPDIFAEKQEVVSELIISAVNQALYASQEALKQEMAKISKRSTEG